MDKDTILEHVAQLIEEEEKGLVPALEVIEGEVVDLPKVPFFKQPLSRKKIILMLSFLFLISVIVTVLLIPFFMRTASVAIIPDEQYISQNIVLQAPSASLVNHIEERGILTVPATQRGHKNAQAASGVITFFNTGFTPVTIEAGTLIQAESVNVITTSIAFVSAGNGYTNGIGTAFAVADVTGTVGNIPAYTINSACCKEGILARNVTAFSGGREAYDFLEVGKSDIENAVARLHPLLTTSAQDHLEGSISQLTSEPICTQKLLQNVPVGVEAKSVTVTLLLSCKANVYDKQTVIANFKQAFVSLGKTRLGSGYQFFGSMTTGKIFVKGNTIETVCSGSFAYMFTSEQIQNLANIVSGKTKKDALTALSHVRGVKQATIKQNLDFLPLPSANRIQVVVFSQA